MNGKPILTAAIWFNSKCRKILNLWKHWLHVDGYWIIYNMTKFQLMKKPKILPWHFCCIWETIIHLISLKQHMNITCFIIVNNNILGRLISFIYFSNIRFILIKNRLIVAQINESWCEIMLFSIFIFIIYRLTIKNLWILKFTKFCFIMLFKERTQMNNLVFWNKNFIMTIQ